MSKSWAVRVIEFDGHGQETVAAQTVVYADTELEARTQGAALLGERGLAVRVSEIETLPSDAELARRQAEAVQANQVPDFMRNIHGQ